MYEYWEIYVCCWGDGRGKGRGDLEMKIGNGWTAGYIWYHVARKKTWRGSKAILYMLFWNKKNVGGLRFKSWNEDYKPVGWKKNGTGLQAAISNKAKMYWSQNHHKKSNVIVRFPSALYHQTHLLMTSRNSINHMTDITYTSEIFPTII